MAETIGIFALQGDFDKHKAAVEAAGHKALLVKTANSLKKCSRLIIPGGESTTFLKLVDKLEMREPLLDFAENHKVMGTCAGLIILAKKVLNFELNPLALIDIVVERNAYGRQIDSFVDTVSLNLNGKKHDFEGVFIRAPKIKTLGRGVQNLAQHKDEIVMASEGNILVASFHPELTDDLTVHKYFINDF